MIFGKWLVVKEVPRRPTSRCFLCKCACGTEKIIQRGNLISNDSRSCGCSKGQFITQSKARHAMSETRFYSIWTNMITRCTNERSPNWKRYGGRGINICERWRTFDNFKADMFASYQHHVTTHGERRTSIERSNNNGNYDSTNCRWATPVEQANNRRKRQIKKIT